MAVPRETDIEQSITDHLRYWLDELNYGPDLLTIREAFPTPEERSTPLKKTTLAFGFNFDDGGRLVELGSDLTHRVYTIEFWIFGITNGQGRNVANIIKEIFEAHWIVDLKDVNAPGAPVYDKIVMLDERGVQVQRQIATDPRMWDQNVYTTTVKFEDFYSPTDQMARALP
jgi:hypothetical protein